MATLPVKFFTSSMQGAPQLTNAWGDLTTMLDACLVNGFNLKAVASLTSAAGIATANITAGHLYAVNQVIAMAGADQAEYNGEVRVLSTTANNFTYAITGTPVSPATGASITAKVAPLNFDIAFTGTNKRAYRSKNVSSNRPYLRVDNSLDPLNTTTYAKKGKVTMAEGMSDIDTFVGARAPYDPLFPTKNEVATGSGSSVTDGWHKWYYARQDGGTTDSVAQVAMNRSWVLVGDDRGFYLFTEHSNAYGRVGYCFTDFESYRAGDGFSTLLCATDLYTSASTTPSSGADIFAFFNRTLDAVGKVLMRDHVQVGGPVRAGFATLGTLNSQGVSGYTTGVAWPNGPDYSLVLHPVYLKQENNHLRGKMPGMMWVHNDLSSATMDLAVVGSVVGYPGKTFLLVKSSYATTGQVACQAFDITGPWW